VKPAKKVPVGETLTFRDGSGEVVLRALVVGAGEFGERTLRFERVEDFHAALERIGHLPLPPYIRREKDVEDRAEDRERYQTVYSKPLESAEERGSSARPTAGLHFTPEILEELKERGVEIARLTLHVGLGTFQPVRAERTEEIQAACGELYDFCGDGGGGESRAAGGAKDCGGGDYDDADAGASRRFICSTPWPLFFGRITRCSGRGR
jgi:S-adenosylmethionine:tRNA-ribosyltransferase-isomerase (queuine synthetase)